MQNDLPGAIAKFDQALEIDSNFIDAYFNRGLARYSLSDYQDAIADFSAAIDRDASFAEAFGRRGLSYYAAGNRAKAIADLQQAAALFQQQGDQVGYQQSLDLIEMIQP